MTATTTARTATQFAGHYPARGTAPAAANTRLVKGTMVALNTSGEAIAPAVDQGFPVVGVASANFDNRTGSEAGGLAGNIDVEMEYGVFSFAVQGSAPIPGDVLFVYDNQTVTTDSNSGARGIVGPCTEVRPINGVVQAFVWVGPHTSGLYSVEASEAADLDQAEADIVALQAAAVIGMLPIPLDSFRAADGTSLTAFNDGVAHGFAVSEGLMYRWNPSAVALAPIWTTIALPPDLDDAADINVHVLASRIGSSDTTVVLTMAAFFQTVAAAFTADADAGGNTGAINAATTVVQEVSRAIAAADVPAAPCSLSLSIIPSAALDADDLNIHAVWLEFTKAL